MLPETKYAKSGETSIAYQVIGEGPIDLLYVMGWVSNVEYAWEEPSVSRFLMRLASFSRLILFDKRGTGLSDKVSQLPTLEQRMDDVRSVMDAAGSERAALFGISEGGPMCTLFAATYPERTTALIMYGSYAKRTWDPDYPWAPTPEQRQIFFDSIKRDWGGVVDLAILAPSAAHDERFKHWWATYLRRSASPADALALAKMNTNIDIRDILRTIHVPTLLIHRRGDMDIDVGGSRYMAGQIPDAKFVELAGDDHLPWVGDQDAILNEIEIFLTGELKQPDNERILATVLFTDIVNSTKHISELGDTSWRYMLQSYQSSVRKELERFRGKEIDSAGDSFLTLFDGPARAIGCAFAIINSMQGLGIQLRAGVHTGECEVIEKKVGGIAVHMGARVMAEAGPGEVFVSGTVKDLVSGSGLHFIHQGKFLLKGIPGETELYSVDQH